MRKTLLVSSLALATTIAAPFAFAASGSVRKLLSPGNNVAVVSTEL